MNEAFEDPEIYKDTPENPEDKFSNIQQLSNLRETMSINYPNSFRIKEPSDAQLFLALLHQLFAETDLKDLVQKTFNISYISFDEHDQEKTKERHTYFLTIPADDIVVGSSLVKICPKISLRHKLIRLAKHTLAYPESSDLDVIKTICKGEEGFKEPKPLSLIREPPAIITFYLQYGEYFNSVDSEFSSRREMIHLLPPSFPLFDLFTP
mmetsp:Transcript_36573/g.36178  ORF Transcript_36573/g.36178 Transcript_36573/m.36178 type:complete len:209 (+) Transcript_36573:188-814(+)